MKLRRVVGHRPYAVPLALVLFWAFPGVIHAQSASIEEVVVTNSTSDLLLYCNVANSFTPEMEEGVRNGIPVVFTFFVDLKQNRSFLPNREIVSLSFDHVLSYDSLKEEYRVVLPGDNAKSVNTRSAEEAKRLMAGVNGFKVVSLKKLMPAGNYTIAIKARLAKKTLPLNFHYVVPFWHLWDFETDWRNVQFRY